MPFKDSPVAKLFEACDALHDYRSGQSVRRYLSVEQDAFQQFQQGKEAFDWLGEIELDELSHDEFLLYDEMKKHVNFVTSMKLRAINLMREKQLLALSYQYNTARSRGILLNIEVTLDNYFLDKVSFESFLADAEKLVSYYIDVAVPTLIPKQYSRDPSGPLSTDQLQTAAYELQNRLDELSVAYEVEQLLL